MINDVRNIAPFIDTVFYVTSPFGWRIDPITGERKFHKGLDIATPSPGSPLYSIVEGKVIGKGYFSQGLGYYVIIKNNDNIGAAFLYAHLREESPLNTGDEIVYGDYVGYEGTSGYSTGIHLHIEYQVLGSSDNWDFTLLPENYPNPVTYIGMDNIDNTAWYYDGVPIPPKPVINKSNNKFKFVLYANKLRNRRLNYVNFK